MTTDVVAVLGRGLVDPAAPAIWTDDLGLTRGDGCFEGCRVRRSEGTVVVDDLELHLDRMASSARGLDIAFDRAAWQTLVESSVSEWDRARPADEEASLKLVLTRGREGGQAPTGLASVSRIAAGVLAARREGVDVVTLARGVGSDSFADCPWLLGGVKTLSYALNMAAQREARRRGADDAIFVSTDGRVLEAPTAAVAWVNDTRVTTVPPGGNGILASISAERLLRVLGSCGFTTAQDQATVRDLLAAEAVILVSSVRGPVLVRSIDGQELAATERGTQVVSASQELLHFQPGQPGSPVQDW